jgi:arylformamidase
MGRLYDITLPVDAALACWPGDTPYSFELGWKRSEGAPVNVGTARLSVHTGTHADAPFHFDDAAPGIGELPLDAFLGPARVVDVSGAERITREHLAGIDFAATPRLLFHTGAWPDRRRFPEQVPVMEPDLPSYLGKRGVLLVGVDVPSVDAIESEDLPNHRALTAAGITILESLYLQDTPEGEYELIALPLKLLGADGSPIRAVLRALS